MKKLIVICLVLITGALSAQNNPRKGAMKAQTEKKQAGSNVKSDSPPAETNPSAEPSVQPASPQNRSIDEKGVSTKSAPAKKQAVIQPDSKVNTEEKKAQGRPQ
jgi:hypothetical protein